MRQRVRSVVTLIALLLLALLPSAPASHAAGELCFTETGHCISGRFREFWEQNGGLLVFGYPITPARDEVNADTGRSYLTQWFERNRFELHPENQRPYDVLLGRLGNDRLVQQGRNWFTFPKADPSAPHYFAETGHAIAEVFWSYWSSHGLEFDGRPGASFAESLALFGLPLSEPALETNASGDTVLTQWFERARFEHHPNNPASHTVLLGLLGGEVRGGVEPPPPPPPPAAVSILSHSAYVSSIDSLHVVGEVRNDLTGNVRFVKIVASFYDGAGTLVGSDFTYARLDVLKPGQRSPFEFILTDPSPNIAGYRLQVEWRTTNEQPLEGLTILSHGTRDSSLQDARYIYGEVRNDSGGTAQFVKIVITLYNNQGVVVGTDFTYTDLSTLAAGQSSPFETLVLPWNNAARYELQVEGDRPERPVSEKIGAPGRLRRSGKRHCASSLSSPSNFSHTSFQMLSSTARRSISIYAMTA